MPPTSLCLNPRPLNNLGRPTVASLQSCTRNASCGPYPLVTYSHHLSHTTAVASPPTFSPLRTPPNPSSPPAERDNGRPTATTRPVITTKHTLTGPSLSISAHPYQTLTYPPRLPTQTHQPIPVTPLPAPTNDTEPLKLCLPLTTPSPQPQPPPANANATPLALQSPLPRPIPWTLGSQHLHTRPIPLLPLPLSLLRAQDYRRGHGTIRRPFPLSFPLALASWWGAEG
jgi:hypothetical protein